MGWADARYWWCVIKGAPRQPVRLVWYATSPGTLSPYIGVAEAFAHHASLAMGAVTERDNMKRAVAARHRVGAAPQRLAIGEVARSGWWVSLVR